jgi:hypothetical protein
LGGKKKRKTEVWASFASQARWAFYFWLQMSFLWFNGSWVLFCLGGLIPFGAELSVGKLCVCVSLSLSLQVSFQSLWELLWIKDRQQIRVLVFFLGWWWLTWYPILWWLERRMPNWDVSICHLFCLQQRWRIVDSFLFNFSFIHIFGEEMVGWSVVWFLSSQRLQIAMILLLWACISECVTAWSNWVQFLFETHECKKNKFPVSTQ